MYIKQLLTWSRSQNPPGSCGCSGCSAAGWLVVAALLALPPPVLGRHAAALELWTRLVESGLCVCVWILPEVLSGVFWVQSCDETVPFRPGQRERERERERESGGPIE